MSFSPPHLSRTQIRNPELMKVKSSIASPSPTCAHGRHRSRPREEPAPCGEQFLATSIGKAPVNLEVYCDCLLKFKREPPAATSGLCSASSRGEEDRASGEIKSERHPGENGANVIGQRPPRLGSCKKRPGFKALMTGEDENPFKVVTKREVLVMHTARSSTTKTTSRNTASVRGAQTEQRVVFQLQPARDWNSKRS